MFILSYDCGWYVDDDGDDVDYNDVKIVWICHIWLLKKDQELRFISSYLFYVISLLFIFHMNVYMYTYVFSN